MKAKYLFLTISIVALMIAGLVVILPGFLIIPIFGAIDHLKVKRNKTLADFEKLKLINEQGRKLSDWEVKRN